MARALIAAGRRDERAYELARRVEVDLAQRGERGRPRPAGRARRRGLGEDAAHGRSPAAPLRACRARHPVILLVGGGTGTGKSTIATEVAHRLGITRVTSTDFVRQTMRAFFAQAFMPSVHYSSFEAGLGLTKAEEEEAGDAALLGFLDQTRNVLVGVEAAIERSLAEGWSMVLEGVHLVPGMVDRARGRARRPVPARDRGRGARTAPLLGARRDLGRPAAAREVPRRDARDPADPGSRSIERAQADVPVIMNIGSDASTRRWSSSSSWLERASVGAEREMSAATSAGRLPLRALTPGRPSGRRSPAPAGSAGPTRRRPRRRPRAA